LFAKPIGRPNKLPIFISDAQFAAHRSLSSITAMTSQASSLTISNIPVGATISDGHGINSFTATSGNASLNIVGWFPRGE
jgi:hypothetical protein